MLKRILIFLLVMTISFSCLMFSVQTNADENPPDSKTLQFAKAIGMIDMDADGTAAFTRVELAKLVTRILVSSDDKLAYDIENVFSDVKAADVPFVMTATNAGILNGVGGGRFAPDKNVTYIQFLKAMVVLLGRDKEALAHGGYPTGYYITAKNLGITDNEPPDVNYDLTYNGVANVLKLMQNTNLVVYEDNGEPVYLNKSYLEYYLDIDFVSGIISSIDGISIDENNSGPGTIRIGNDIFALTDSLKDMGYLAGYSADAYYKISGLERNIVFFIDDFDNNVVTIDAEDLSKADGNEIIYTKNNKEIKLNINSNKTRLIYNNKYTPNYTVDKLNPFLTSNMDGNVVVIDNNGDRVYDVVKVKAYKTYVVDRIVDEVIYNKYNKNEYLDLKELDKNSVVNVIMQTISPELIEEGDLISVMKDTAGKVQTVIVTIDTYEGTLMSIEEDGTRISKMQIDELVFDVAYSFENSPNRQKLQIGQKLKVYLNPEGRVSDANTEDYEGFRIGYFIDADVENGMQKSCRAMLLTASGDINTYLLKDKIKSISGTGVEITKKSEEFLSDLISPSDGRFIRQPIIYKLNSQDEISYIRLWSGTGNEKDGFYQYEGFDGGVNNLNSDYYYWRSGTNSFGSRVLLNDATIIFSVPKDETGTDKRDRYEFYTITDASYFINNGKQTGSIEAYGTKKYNPVAEILVVYNDANHDEILVTNDVVVVSKISRVSQDGVGIVKIDGWQKGAEVSLKADNSVAVGLVPGDIIRVHTNKESLVKNIEKVFSYSTRTIEPYDSPSDEKPEWSHPGGNKPTTLPKTSNRFIYSKAFWSDEYAITLEMDDTLKNLDSNAGTDVLYESYPINKFNIVTVDTSGRELTFKKGSSDDILSVKNNTIENASDIFIHTRNGDCKTMVIYN